MADGNLDVNATVYNVKAWIQSVLDSICFFFCRTNSQPGNSVKQAGGEFGIEASWTLVNGISSVRSTYSLHRILSSRCLGIVGIPGLTMMRSVAGAESDLENSAQLLRLGRIQANAIKASNAEETVDVEVDPGDGWENEVRGRSGIEEGMAPSIALGAAAAAEAAERRGEGQKVGGEGGEGELHRLSS